MRPMAARQWGWPVMTFCVVLVAQLWLVRAAGTDVPFQDQWDVEGRWLYPAWRTGAFAFHNFFHAYNEHHIAWTHLLNVTLFSVNGQWDPLVQLVAGAFLRAASATLLVGGLARGVGRRRRAMLGIGIMVVFLPHLAWHNALWGFQSSVYFVLLFALSALRCLSTVPLSRSAAVAGTVAAVASLFALGSGSFVPIALMGLLVVRAAERRQVDATDRKLWGVAAVLLGAVVVLNIGLAGDRTLHAYSAAQFLGALGRMLAWPHSTVPAAALVLNLPLAATIYRRIGRRSEPTPAEDFALAIGFWSLTGAVATAWARGGSDEMLVGVPSRYVDFVVLLPIVNAWCVLQLLAEARRSGRSVLPALTAAWALFLAIGWFGLSTEMMRRVVLPRMRDRDAPVRLIAAYRQSEDPRVFDGEPRLLVPHAHLETVRAVLHDPRMQGALPPSLQPARPMGPLSRAVRILLCR